MWVAVYLLAVAGSPCVAAPLKLLALGDSNTAGTPLAPGAYRTRLWQDFGSDPTKLEFLGSQVSGPPELGDQAHEGHSGFTIAAAPVGFGNLADGLRSYLNARINPDFILLMIGTNDVNLNYQVDQAPARLDSLISRISDLSTGLKPNAKLIVASIPPIDDAHNQFRTGLDTMANSRAMVFNAAVPGVVAAHRARGERVFFADINSALTLADIDDGLHPTRAGYDKIGDAFYSAIFALPEPGGMQYLCVAIGIAACLARIRRERKPATVGESAG
jgi:lysophospholipase L1-like esterase